MVYRGGMNGLDKAIDLMGGQLALAKALNIPGHKPGMVVYQWTKRGVPAARVLEIERVTKGKVKRHELRPDLYPRTG
jgi:DNA-binding transcriptional regulator YdaS (Cro superfamily)